MLFVMEKVQKLFVTLIQCVFSTTIILQIISTTTIQLQLHPHFLSDLKKNILNGINEVILF